MHFARSPKMAAAALITVLLGLPQLAYATKPSRSDAATKCEVLIDQSPTNRRLINESDCKPLALTFTDQAQSERRGQPLSHRTNDQIYSHDRNYDRGYRHDDDDDDQGYNRGYNHHDHYSNHGNHSQRAFIRELDRLNYEIDRTRLQIRELELRARYNHGYGYERQIRALGRRLDWLKDRKRDLKRRRVDVDNYHRPYRAQG